MRRSSPQTVDISAEPMSGFAPAAAQPKDLQPRDLKRDFKVAVRRSLGIDAFLVSISLLVGVLCSIAVGAIVLPADTAGDLGRAFFLPSQWLVVAICLLPSLLFVLLDGLSATSNPAALPFARSKSSMQAIYASRVHLLLLAVYFTAILMALCWSALLMPLVSKMFVAAIFSFALYALGQSIPSTRMSFIVSGILFLVVLMLTQAFMVLRLEADAGKASQKVLDELNEPQLEKEEPSTLEDNAP